MTDVKDYLDWCYLNKEGMKKYGDIFPTKTLPILSMVQIVFEHSELEKPERAYLLRGSDLTDKQLDLLVDKIARRFNVENDNFNKSEIRKDILNNNVPIREKLTSGSGTKRMYMYM